MRKRKWLAGVLLAIGIGMMGTGKGEVTVSMISEMQRQALVLAGCDMTRFDEQNPRFTERILLEATEYLEQVLVEKYPGTEFNLQACVRRGLNQEYDVFELIPDRKPDQEFEARVYGSKGKFSCTEGYYGVQKTPVYEQWIGELISSVEPQAQVFSTIPTQFPESVNAETTLEEAMALADVFSYTWILVEDGEGEFSQRVTQIRNILEENRVEGDWAVYLLSSEAEQISGKEDAFARIPGGERSGLVLDSARFILRWEE